MAMRIFAILCLTIIGFVESYARPKTVGNKSVLPDPSAQPTALVFSNIQSTSMTLTWTAAAPPPSGGYIVLRSAGSPSLDAPVDGTSYTAGDIIGSTTVAFFGSGVTFNDLSLSPATEYYYKIYSYDVGPPDYLLTGPLTGNRFTLATEPTNQPTTLLFSNIQSNSVMLGWTGATGAPDGYIVLRRKGVSPSDVPVDGTTYSVGSTIGSSTVVQVGTFLLFTDGSLTSSTRYFYDIFSFNGNSSSRNYLVTSPLEGNAITLVSSIQNAEYFFDTDPGVGSGSLFSITSGSTIDATFTAASSGLSKGMHILGIRIRDNTLLWSMTSYTPIYVLSNNPLTSNNITAVEYFFDTDPGVGSATAVSVGAPATFITLDIAANSSALSVGMHIFGLRTRDVNNEWSVAAYTPVYFGYDQTITKLEYFFDTEPGVGAGTSIDVVPDTDVLDQIYSMNSSALAAGAHTLSIRTAGQGNLWSLPETVAFTICSAASPSISADVVCVGSATTLTDASTGVLAGDVFSWDFESDAVEDANTAGDKTFTFPSAGTYTAELTIDRAGCIATATTTVTVDDAATVSAGVDQTICVNTDATMAGTIGGTASSANWSTSGDGNFNGTLNPNAIYTTGASDKSTGSVTLTYTTDDPPGACAAEAASITLTINALAVANAGSDVTLCGGSAVPLSGVVSGSASSGNWTTLGDGVFDNASSLTAQYTPGANDISAGTVMLTLHTDDPAGPCTNEDDDMFITISAPPTVNAGANQFICGNGTASLGGTRGGSATTSTWTTGGDGSFNDASLLNAVYTPGASDVSAGSVVLTLTTNDPAGPCTSVNDQMTVSMSQPINIISQSVSVAVSASTSVTVTTGGTFNAGDELTTTIQAAAKKGTAQIQSGNILAYTANANTVGKDSVQVRVCNQCAQCDMEFIFFNIQNVAPTITIPPSLTAPTGQVFSLPLALLILDGNNNQDLSTLAIVSQPISGATASIDASYHLNIDYTGISFSGTDQLDIRVCDFSGVCTTETFYIQVGDPQDIRVYNAVSPNGDGKHDFLEITNIELHPENRVKIFNRWGDVVFEADNYDNTNNVFTGKSNVAGRAELPTGTYYYVLEISGKASINGFLVINR